MKSLTSLCTVFIAGLTLANPASVFAKRGHHHGGHHYHHGGGYGYRPYCAPVSYGSYYAPRYYGGSGLSIGFSTAPAYYGSGSYYGGGNYYGSGAYYDSYPTRTVYRGGPVVSYRASARYDEDLAVDVQRALARRGFYRGAIDGDVGPGTRAAIRSYQYRRGFEVTGRIDGTLLRSLQLS